MWQTLTEIRAKGSLTAVAAASVLLAGAMPRNLPATPSSIASSQAYAMQGSAEFERVEPVDPSVEAMPVVAVKRLPTLKPARVTVTRHVPPRLSAANLCLSRSAECQETFNAALRSTLVPVDVVVTAHGSAEIVGPPGAEPLRFQKRAPWVRRLEKIGKEGIPFVRIPRGPDSEVVVGINRKGMLGVSLRQKAD